MLAACALNGHLHLVQYLLTKEAEDSCVGSALAITLYWNGPLNTVEALCRHLEGRAVNLDAIHIDRSSECHTYAKGLVGAIEHALHGVLSEYTILRDEKHKKRDSPQDVAALEPLHARRMDAAFAKVSWLAAHTKAELRPGSFAHILTHYTLSDMYRRYEGDEAKREREMTEAIVHRLTQLCMQELGASWSDKQDDSQRSTVFDGLNALQLLTNAGWLEVVGWLARERGAPLQGLVLSGRLSDPQPVHVARLKQLQEEQARSWELAESRRGAMG